MKPGPNTAKQLFLEAVRIDEEPRPAIEWLVSICLEQNWCGDDAEAREKAEKWQEQFLTLLRNEIREYRSIGRFVRFDFNSSSEYYLQGCAFQEPRDAADVKEAKARRSRYEEYRVALTSLTPRQFEGLCVGVIGVLGVENPITTSYSADEGIDFYGRLRLEQFILPGHHFQGVQHQLNAWMIGQAKHYGETDASTFAIRELVGSVELAKGRAFGSVSEKYTDLNIKACDPVFYLFFTTGRITANSWRLMDRSGVVGMDGEMIAALLADNNIGVVADIFDSGTFNAWVAEHLGEAAE